MKIKKIIKIFLITILFFIILISQFNYYPDAVASNMIKYVEIKDKNIFISSENSNELIIFYPGAKVQIESYIPLLYNFKDYKIDVIIVKMPLNLAIFGKNKADSIIEQYKHKYEKIYIMGHSLGGAMASEYAFDNKYKLSGLILVGSYPYKPYEYDKTISIYGNVGKIEKRNKIKNESHSFLLKYEINGANHANFGNYGKQIGDKDATINKEEQQKITIENILKFIQK